MLFRSMTLAWRRLTQVSELLTDHSVAGSVESRYSSGRRLKEVEDHPPIRGTEMASLDAIFRRESTQGGRCEAHLADESEKKSYKSTSLNSRPLLCAKRT